MGPNFESQKFNDDLLAIPEDRELAASMYPHLIHVLVHPELQQMFACYDVPANADKRRSLWAGLAAIGLGTIALLMASAAILSDNLAFVAAILGVMSGVFGFSGVLYGPAKRRWLAGRLMTERLRQLHFQTFVCHLHDIVRSLASADGVTDYTEARAQWFATFKLRFQHKQLAELTGILEGRRSADVWLHELTVPDPAIFKTDLRDLFGAYRALRITHQLQYANYKLRDEGNLWTASAKKLEWLLSQAALVFILLLFVFDVTIAVGSVVHASQLNMSPWPHLAAIWCAIVALAIRALGEGLGVREETARYRDYRNSVEAIRERFDQATDPLEKWRIMQDMERLSYEEMCSFLHNGQDLRFVM